MWLATASPLRLDKYRACKLVFLADKHHLVQHGRPITGDAYFALEYGPVPTCVLDIIGEITNGEPVFVGRAIFQEFADAFELDRTFSSPKLLPRVEPDRTVLSDSDMAALNHVIRQHGYKSFEELKSLTHEMVAWQRAWEHRREGNRAPMLFEEFFEQDEDAVTSAYDEMIENAALRSTFPEPSWI